MTQSIGRVSPKVYKRDLEGRKAGDDRGHGGKAKWHEGGLGGPNSGFQVHVFQDDEEGRNCGHDYAHGAKGTGMGLQIPVPTFPPPRLLGSEALNKSHYLKEDASSSEKWKVIPTWSKGALPAAGKVCNALRWDVPYKSSVLKQPRVTVLTRWWHQTQPLTSLHSTCPSLDLTILALTVATTSHFVISIHHQPLPNRKCDQVSLLQPFPSS